MSRLVSRSSDCMGCFSNSQSDEQVESRGMEVLVNLIHGWIWEGKVVS